MIDFNDTAVPTGNQPRIVSDAEREELRAELLARLESVLFTLSIGLPFRPQAPPQGCRQGYPAHHR